MPQQKSGPPTITVEASPEPRKNLMKRNIEDLLHRDTVESTRSITGKVGNGLKTAGQAAAAIFGSLGDITKLGIDKTTSKPVWLTAIAGAGGLIAAVKSIKNILKSFSTMIRPNQDPKVGWLPRMLQGVLQGGLALGLTAPFLGRKNIFTEQIDGKPAVPIKSIVGAAVASFLLGIAIKLAEATSVWRKVPIIGPAMQEIAETVIGATREVTVPTEQGQRQGPGAGIPGLAG